MQRVTRQQIYNWLEEVKDPEIPVLSLVDLGVINDVILKEHGVIIEMTPTFVGCPALEMMKNDIAAVLMKHGIDDVHINVSFKQPWSSEKISEKGRQALKAFGLAPPPAQKLFEDLDFLDIAPCPRCDGTNTELRNTFGATLCRSIHYCRDCQEAFEQFKSI